MVSSAPDSNYDNLVAENNTNSCSHSRGHRKWDLRGSQDPVPCRGSRGRSFLPLPASGGSGVPGRVAASALPLRLWSHCLLPFVTRPLFVALFEGALSVHRRPPDFPGASPHLNPPHLTASAKTTFPGHRTLAVASIRGLNPLGTMTQPPSPGFATA